MIAQQRENIAAIVAESVQLRLALLVLRDLIVGKQALHAVEAFQILPRGGNYHRQHDKQREQYAQRAAKAAAAARCRLRPPEFLAGQIVLFPIIH